MSRWVPANLLRPCQPEPKKDGGQGKRARKKRGGRREKVVLGKGLEKSVVSVVVDTEVNQELVVR